MGRRRTSNHHLPPRMHMKGRRYFHVTGGSARPRKWTALGSEWPTAIRKYAELESEAPPVGVVLFRDVVTRYRREVMPRKSIGTQKRNRYEIDRLEMVFGAVPLEQIKPRDVREYMDARGEAVQASANREKALLSHMFNCAREWGYTDAPNPCAGVKGFSEPGRDRYVTDDEYQAVWNAADEHLRNVMDLCYLTAQRPGDVLKLLRTDVKDGAIEVRQQKTGKRVRIEIVGPLAAVVARVEAQRGDVAGATFLHDDKGRRITSNVVRGSFDRARTKAGVSFQLRDLRAKAATDLNDLGHAQKLLGHANRSMTEHYAGRRRGEMVAPVLRRLSRT